MSLNRRGFLKVLGVAGATLAIGKDMKGSPAPSDGIEFRAILYDATRCKGCRGCEYDCADANGLPEPPPTAEIKGLRKTDITANTVVNEYNTSKGTVYFKSQCMHCNEPACAAACLTQAMHKTKAGPVIWDSNKCMGCRYCMVSCPFDIPKFEYHSPNPKIHKCTMCWDRLKTGKFPPACTIVRTKPCNTVHGGNCCMKRRKGSAKIPAYITIIYTESGKPAAPACSACLPFRLRK